MSNVCAASQPPLLQAQLRRLQSQEWWGLQLAKGSVGLGCAYVGGIWWITKGVTKVCLCPVTIPVSILHRVLDVAREHQSLVYELYPEVSGLSIDVDVL